MEKYLRGTLQLPGPKLPHLVDDPKLVTFDTDQVADPSVPARPAAVIAGIR